MSEKTKLEHESWKLEETIEVHRRKAFYISSKWFGRVYIDMTTCKYVPNPYTFGLLWIIHHLVERPHEKEKRVKLAMNFTKFELADICNEFNIDHTMYPTKKELIIKLEYKMHHANRIKYTAASF